MLKLTKSDNQFLRGLRIKEAPFWEVCDDPSPEYPSLKISDEPLEDDWAFPFPSPVSAVAGYEAHIQALRKMVQQSGDRAIRSEEIIGKVNRRYGSVCNALFAAVVAIVVLLGFLIKAGL